MTTKDYAAHLSLGERTIKELIAEGLPSIKVGRARRIVVIPADAWVFARAKKKERKGREKRKAAANTREGKAETIIATETTETGIGEQLCIAKLE
jgi:excisionase family DNA binding protein